MKDLFSIVGLIVTWSIIMVYVGGCLEAAVNKSDLTYDDGFNDGVSAIVLLCNQDKEVHLTSSNGDILLKCNVVNPI